MDDLWFERLDIYPKTVPQEPNRSNNVTEEKIERNKEVTQVFRKDSRGSTWTFRTLERFLLGSFGVRWETEVLSVFVVGLLLRHGHLSARRGNAFKFENTIGIGLKF